MDPKIKELADHYRLKYETVEDLLKGGWEHRSEYYGVPQFIHPLANMHKANVFDAMKENRLGRPE